MASIFAAIQMIIVAIPIPFPIGGTGGYLFLSLISASIIGYLLGPRYGTMAVFIGTLIGGVLHPLFLDVNLELLRYLIALAPAVVSFIAGGIKESRFTRVPVVYLVFLIAFVSLSLIIQPLLVSTLTFLWFHFIVFLYTLLLFSRYFKNKFADGLDISIGKKWLANGIAIFLLIFISITIGHLVELVLEFYYLATMSIQATSISPEASSMVIAYLESFFTHYYNLSILIYPPEIFVSAIFGGIVVILILIVKTRLLSPPTSHLDAKE
jgi:hypothetical protein